MGDTPERTLILALSVPLVRREWLDGGMSPSTPAAVSPRPIPRAPLVRSRDQRVVAGVAAGLADHLGISPLAARGALLVFGALGGAGVLFYVWLWVTVPLGELAESPVTKSVPRTSAEPLAQPVPTVPTLPTLPSGRPVSSPQRGRSVGGSRLPVAEFLLGGALLVAGVGLVLAQLGLGIDLTFVLPAMVVLVGVGLAWWQIADRDHPERHQLPRVLGALGLVAVGMLTFFTTASEPSVFTVIAAALAVLAGVSLALAPWVLRINRDLIAERAARARESERAEIAAHLHDSVLQTLAAIQQRSDPGSEVARLARGQERELREWLFRASDEREASGAADLDVALRAHAAALEAAHAVRFDVVAVGTGAGVDIPEAIVAAAREAMLNAARHAGGTVSVYAEVARGSVSIDVTDRGPGIDLGALPEGRMGVRESILGRMERAGGTAHFAPGPGGTGTSVRLRLGLTEERGDDVAG